MEASKVYCLQMSVTCHTKFLPTHLPREHPLEQHTTTLIARPVAR